MPSKALDQMSPDELCAEAGRIRQELSASSDRLGQVYDFLYRSSRRNVRASAEETRAYVTLANAGKRLVGMMSQAIRRTSAVDQAVMVAKSNALEAEERRLRQEKSKEARSQKRKAQEEREKADKIFHDRLFGSDPETTQDDLIELYGKD